jgi:hypothetical protein
MSHMWRPRPGYQLSMLWMRCDHCKWSGDPSRFNRLWHEKFGDIDICDHQWCWSLAKQAEYRANGWQCAAWGKA